MLFCYFLGICCSNYFKMYSYKTIKGTVEKESFWEELLCNSFIVYSFFISFFHSIWRPLFNDRQPFFNFSTSASKSNSIESTFAVFNFNRNIYFYSSYWLNLTSVTLKWVRSRKRFFLGSDPRAVWIELSLPGNAVMVWRTFGGMKVHNKNKSQLFLIMSSNRLSSSKYYFNKLI